MKVLIFSSYLYNQSWPEFTKNKTGYGKILNDIVNALGDLEEVYAISYTITSGRGENILSHTFWDLLKCARMYDFFEGIKAFFKYNLSFKNRLKHIYYYLNKGYVRRTIKTLKPDVIHVHGIGTAIIPVIEVCKETKVPYVVSLHGMIKEDDEATIYDKKAEEELIKNSYEEKVPITVVSTGVKQRLEKAYLGHPSENISVVLNGTRVPNEKLMYNSCTSIIDTLNDPDIKVITVLGTLCERKNQIQIVRTFANGGINHNCKVLLCGQDASNGYISREITNAGLQDVIYVIGHQSQESIKGILAQAHLNVVVSIDEGYGLSIIEGFVQGVPTVTFPDLDAVNDLFNENAMVLAKGREDSDLAEAINMALDRTWDKDWIIEYAKRISLEKMALDYQSEYIEILKTGGYPNQSRTIDYIKIMRHFGYKVLCYVGNITDNKNQLSLAEVLNDIQEEKIIAVFAGGEGDGNRLRRKLVDNNLYSKAILAGFCTEMESIWENVDLNVFISKNDGFGLAIIEGYKCGIPCVINKNLDAFSDLFDEKCCVSTSLVPEEIVTAIDSGLIRIWDRDFIREYSKKFSLENMACNYVSILKNTCQYASGG
ncbi:glycosyltransferase family 4 protein [Butyrivibrio sp. XPD2002]|uniref:glycosyltransferase family 4 protein n=1 Tax=Butyrivibrio sp. XPD2002 TaxID=1280665 RepID=UPI00040A50C6|nr:glycosyltransferase [Butyrivibrio sp. XPD2002]